MKYSVLDIVQKATAELGLTPPASVVSSTDTTVIQMLGLLNALCDELVKEKDWSALQTEYTLSTVALTDTYTFPSDYDRILDNTEWNRSARLPLLGPQSPASWQQMKGWMIGAVQYSFRLLGNKLQVFPVPQSVVTLAFEYISSAYVIDGTTQLPKLIITQDSDKFVFDDRLLINGLKMKFKNANGLKSDTEMYDYDTLLNALKGSDAGGATLSLSRRNSGMPQANVPIGNWTL